jgi:hypothetical protein
MFAFDFVNGMTLGLEHISGDEEDNIVWMIVVHLLVFRFMFGQVILELDDEEEEA